MQRIIILLMTFLDPRITAVESGTVLPYVATADNGWHAVIVADRVGWVSGKYSKIE